MASKTIVFELDSLAKEYRGLAIPRKEIIALLNKLMRYGYELLFLSFSKEKRNDLLLALLANENVSFEVIEGEKKFFENFYSVEKRFPESVRYYVTGKAEATLNLPESLGFKVLKNLQGDEQIIKALTSILQEKRCIAHTRNTKETKIALTLNLDGKGQNEIKTGIGFLDHMLDLLAKHANFDLTLNVKGDLEVDEHHTIEDTAIALGEGMKKALGDKKGITRYAFSLPMDESSAYMLLDVSNRPFLKFKATFSREKVGDFPTEMVEHFYYSFCLAAGITLHVELKGKNDHHQIEAGFKTLAKCLEQAVSIKNDSLPSTKGTL